MTFLRAFNAASSPLDPQDDSRSEIIPLAGRPSYALFAHQTGTESSPRTKHRTLSMKDHCYCYCEREFAPASGVKCPGCTELYCSQSCVDEAADWHVRRCANPYRPLTTADTLTAAVFADTFPDDPQTLEDFFFARARTAEDKKKLLGLYIGVVKYLNIKPSKLDEWRVSGMLGENIKELGGYYAWFLQNLNLFKPLLTPEHTCASCGVAAAKRCPKCKKVWYCSRECQVKEWSGHRVRCDPTRDVTSADILKAAAHDWKVPTDPEVIAGYGFDRAADESGQKMLLDVYRVVFDGGAHPRDVERWKNSGIVLQEVEKVLASLPIWKTGYVKGWFAAHRYVFDPAMPIPSVAESEETRLVGAAIFKLWRKIGDSPCSSVDELHAGMERLGWSERRKEFFFFLGALQHCSPDPDLLAWLDLGFCACYDEHEESFLAITYRMLADRCSYEDFYSAFNSSKITALLDAKGLRGRRMAIPNLEDVLSGSPSRFKSVWNLKQHVMAKQGTRANVIPSVHADYGFMNCESDSDYEDLKAMYKKIFERKDANPLKIHEACISGKLYEYTVGMFPKLSKKQSRSAKFKRLMWNVYPLRGF